MNDSSWGTPQTGYWGPSDQGQGWGAAPASPAYDAHNAQHTRPMPVVPDVPEHGGDQDVDRGAARLSGPLFRDEPTRARPLPGEVPQNPEPMPHAPQPAPAPQKKSAGRDLGAAIGLGGIGSRGVDGGRSDKKSGDGKGGGFHEGLLGFSAGRVSASN